MSQRTRVGGVILAAVALLSALLVTGSRNGGRDLLDAGTYHPLADSVVSIAERDAPALPEYSTKIDHVSRTGILTRDGGIIVANLTVRPGLYTVEYSFEARLGSAYRPAELRCGIVDNNGIKSFVAEQSESIETGSGWQRHDLSADFNLPDTTLGIRCVPTSTGLIQASFREISLSVTRMPQ